MAAIAISREIGMAGTQVGQMVARRAGCPCIRREMRIVPSITETAISHFVMPRGR